MQIKKQVKEALDQIYGGGMDQADYAMIIRKIYQSLDDSFYENPPTLDQQKVLKQLLAIADSVEIFYKK